MCKCINIRNYCYKVYIRDYLISNTLLDPLIDFIIKNHQIDVFLEIKKNFFNFKYLTFILYFNAYS